MFLRATIRKKDGKAHRYYSVVENQRLVDGRVQQRPLLYLGEINDAQALKWRKSIEAIDGDGARRTLALFPEDRWDGLVDDGTVVRICLSQLRLERSRQWGAVWLSWQLWNELQLHEFWSEHLPESRKGTRWDQVLFVLVAYRLLAPGSEWRLYRQWYAQTALADLLGADAGLSEIHKLYACHDQLLAHKLAVFGHLKERWVELFQARFEVLLYDLTSTYFESPPPEDASDKRRYGYSRDKRSDCVQVVIALIVTPDGLPLAYEVMAGNTRDSSTLSAFLKQIADQYGQAERTWVMDRGIPTEAVLAQMRESSPPVRYLVGTPKGRLSKLEADLSARPWQQARAGVQVKFLPRDGETYVLAQSADRVGKERGMRLLKLRRLLKRLQQIKAMSLTNEQRLMKLGAAKQLYPAAWRLVEISNDADRAGFSYKLNRSKLRQVRRREGRYLLRTNLTEADPSTLWQHYMQLSQVEQAFKTLKTDLKIRPVWHQKQDRIEAHIFIAFLAYCLQITLSRKLHAHAPGLTARAALEKFATLQMIDVHIPTSDGREIKLTRHTTPAADVQLLLAQLKLSLPEQPPPKIAARVL
jgi:transposase